MLPGMIGLAKAGSTNKSMAINILTNFNDLDMRIFYHTKAGQDKEKRRSEAEPLASAGGLGTSSDIVSYP